MFSNDKNIETIAQLVETCKHYIGLQIQYGKLSATEKIVRLATALILITFLTICFSLALMYISFAVVYALSVFMGLAMAFFIISLCYLLVFLILFIFRKRCIERPLVRFLANILMEK